MATLYISFVIPFAPIDKRAVMLKTLAMCVNIALLSRLFRVSDGHRLRPRRDSPRAR